MSYKCLSQRFRGVCAAANLRNANIMLDAKNKNSYKEGMNKLPNEKRVQILSMLVEGSSMRSISRVVGVSINTVAKLQAEAGEVCLDYHDENVKGHELQAGAMR